MGRNMFCVVYGKNIDNTSEPYQDDDWEPPMPHEAILVIVILGIWFAILRNSFQIVKEFLLYDDINLAPIHFYDMEGNIAIEADEESCGSILDRISCKNDSSHTLWRQESNTRRFSLRTDPEAEMAAWRSEVILKRQTTFESYKAELRNVSRNSDPRLAMPTPRWSVRRAVGISRRLSVGNSSSVSNAQRRRMGHFQRQLAEAQDPEYGLNHTPPPSPRIGSIEEESVERSSSSQDFRFRSISGDSRIASKSAHNVCILNMEPRKPEAKPKMRRKMKSLTSTKEFNLQVLEKKKTQNTVQYPLKREESEEHPLLKKAEPSPQQTSVYRIYSHDTLQRMDSLLFGKATNDMRKDKTEERKEGAEMSIGARIRKSFNSHYSKLNKAADDD